MKRIIRGLICSMIMMALLIPASAFAYTDDYSDGEWQDSILSEAEFNDIISENGGVKSNSSGLITRYNIAVSKSSGKLSIVGLTVGRAEVVKCGFTKVIVQRRTSSNGSWTEYKKYTSLYYNSSAYALSKTLSVPSGYQYRVICTHYAKKNMLNTQKIDNTSNIVSF